MLSSGDDSLGARCAGRGRGRGGPPHRLEVKITNQQAFVKPPIPIRGEGQQMGGATYYYPRRNQRRGFGNINTPGPPPKLKNPPTPRPEEGLEKENEENKQFWNINEGAKLTGKRTKKLAERHSYENGEWDYPVGPTGSRSQCMSSQWMGSTGSVTNGDENCEHIYSQVACHYEHDEPQIIVSQCIKCFNVCCSTDCAELESQKLKPKPQCGQHQSQVENVIPSPSPGLSVLSQSSSLSGNGNTSHPPSVKSEACCSTKSTGLEPKPEPPSQVENVRAPSISGLSVRSQGSSSSGNRSHPPSVKSEACCSTISAGLEPKPEPPTQVENVKTPSISGLSVRSQTSSTSEETFYSCKSGTSGAKSAGIEPKPKQSQPQSQVNVWSPSSSVSSSRSQRSSSSGRISHSDMSEPSAVVAPVAPAPRPPKPVATQGPNKAKPQRRGVFARPKAPGFQESSIQAQLESMKSSNEVFPGSNLAMHDDNNGSRSLVGDHGTEEFAPEHREAAIKKEPVFNRASVVPTTVLKSRNGIMREDIFADYAKSLLEANSGHLIDSPSKWPVGIPFKVHVIGIIPKACIVIQSAHQRAKMEEMMEQLHLTCCSRATPAPFRYVAVAYKSKCYRGQIEEICEFSGKCRVRLVDVGQIVVIGRNEIYSLPEEFLRFPRQIGTVTPINVTPKHAHGDVLNAYLDELLVGTTITATLTHRLQFLADNHYYGEIVLENGQMLSNVLIDTDLAEIHDSRKDNAESIMNPTFKNFDNPRLKKNESVIIVISQILSPDEFFVTKKATDEPTNLREIVQRTIQTMASFGGPGYFHSNYYSGTRMCLAAHPDDVTNMCRSYCRLIDFTVSTPQATVLLIDYGIVYTTDLKELTEYVLQVAEYPPLAYRCRLAGEPTGDNWTDLVRNGLNSLKERSQTEKLTAVCISSNNGTNAVTIRVPNASQYWLQYLEDAGHIKQDMRCVEPPQIMKLPSNWQEYLKSMDPLISLSSTSSETALHSPLFCGRIPPAEPLSMYDKLKTQKLKGCYAYVVMTERCYDMYKDLRSHCSRIYREVSNQNRTLNIGDVVIAPWSRDSCQRACITGFENYFERKYACMFFIDIGRSLRLPVDKLIPADDFCMKMERLCHIVWLEGATEATGLLSNDYNMITSFTQCWTIVSNVTLGAGKHAQYALGLSVVDISGHLSLLTDYFKHFETWDWEKLHDLGICTFKDIFKEMYPDNPFRFSLKDFQMGVKDHFKAMLEGNVTVLLRSAKINHQTKKLDLFVTPAVAKMDFKILTQQMMKFSEKIRLAEPSPESSTYPNLVLVKRMGVYGNADNYVALSKTNCVWHRCIYRDAILSFECVDCCESFKADKNSDLQKLFETHKLDIREIFPEMLKVPPLGLRLVVNLPELPPKLVFKAGEKVLRIGANLEIVVQKYSCLWDDAANMVSGIPATVPKLMERIHEMVEQMASRQRNAPE